MDKLQSLHSRTSGFAVFENIFNENECDILKLHLDDRSKRAGVRHLFGDAVVQSVATDPRLLSIARDFLDSEPVPFKATLFDKSESSNWLVVWHQDRVLPVRSRTSETGWGPWTVKGGIQFAQAPFWAMNEVIALRLHLDPSTEDNGPLKVIPGSHSLGLVDQNEVVRYASKSSHVTCTVGKGGVIAMKPLLIHSSSKSTSPEPRRVLHIEYATRLRLSETIQLALS
ncbi:MAG: phytanoyl-CoA dioxygenase family protein [Pyrinomonadaceae bacterium]|nr:phytanoyl-CoA dioxygenase family protein [Pyrinomonadaceae bacterium]